MEITMNERFQLILNVREDTLQPSRGAAGVVGLDGAIWLRGWDLSKFFLHPVTLYI